MKPRSLLVNSTAALLLVAVSMGAIAASSQDEKRAADQEKMAACFRAHGKLMSKPALMNVYTCWRTHAYLMDR